MVVFNQHTHQLSSAHALVNLPMEWLATCDANILRPEQLYSAGIFPLYTGDWEQAFHQLKHAAQAKMLSAIGECGLDKRSSTPWDEQLRYLSLQMDLATQYQLPLIIHCVKGWNDLIHLHQLHPSPQKRVIHGFRGKPQLAEALLQQGFHLSFGLRFNPDSLRLCPIQRYAAETDNEDVSIETIAQLHQQVRNMRTT